MHHSVENGRITWMSLKLHAMCLWEEEEIVASDARCLPTVLQKENKIHAVA